MRSRIVATLRSGERELVVAVPNGPEIRKALFRSFNEGIEVEVTIEGSTYIAVAERISFELESAPELSVVS